MAAPHFLRTFNVPLFVPLPYFIRGRFANYSTCKINVYIHKATFLSLVKTAALLLRLFNYFSVSMFISLPFLTSLTFLLGFLSAVLIELRSPFAILQLSHCSILLAFILFYCFLAPWLLPSRRYCFSCLGCRAVLRFSLPFLILAAIFLPCHFQRCCPFYRCSASNIAAFHSRLDLELPFFALVLSSPYSFCY